MIGWAFNQLFLPGDVVYGISQPRGRYTATLKTGIANKDSAELMSEGNYTICDHYNNRTFNYDKTSPDDGFSGNGPLSPATIPAQVSKHSLSTAYNAHQHHALDQYYASLNNHMKYNPMTAATVALNAKMRKHNRDQEMLVFRRACKFGLQYFILTLKRRVHFILDVDHNGTCIDFGKIVAKDLYNDGINRVLPITYSELRNCYKNRHAFGNKIFFYLNGFRVQAPWDSHPEIWELYNDIKQPSRVKRLVALAKLRYRNSKINY